MSDNVTTFLQTPFALRMDPSENLFKRGVGNSDWWSDRLSIMRNYWLPCIEAQTNQDFIRTANFEGYSGFHEDKYHLRNMLEENGWHTYFIADHPINQPTPFRMMNMLADTDWVIVFELDSDDLIAPDLMDIVSDFEPEEHKLWFFNTGYIYGINDHKLGIYRHTSSQFYAKCFPTDVLGDEDEFRKYCEAAHWHEGHPQLNKGPNYDHDFAPGRFMHVMHDHNDTSGWDDEHTMSHVTEFIEDEEEKAQILSQFQIDYDG